MNCPNCSHKQAKVIYFGLPGVLCLNHGCSLLTGPAAYVPEAVSHMAVTENGFAFMTYEGSYWRALWDWLRGE